ncbi:MAG: hypothetical protein WC843_03370 [Candidatus Gracilibacteria bacterium]|jgi:hypothetical protein
MTKTPTPRKTRDEWLNFCQSYLSLALLACDEMLAKKYTVKLMDVDIPAYSVPSLFLPTIYNIKHGLEVFLKTLRIILNAQSNPKEGKHSNLEIFTLLKKEIDSKQIQRVIESECKKKPDDTNLKLLLKDLANLSTYVDKIESLVIKYEHCEIIKNKIQTDFTIIDEDNTAFRYPQNSLQIKLDYHKILTKITPEDIQEIRTDAEALVINLNSLGFILDVYSQYK